MATTARHLSPKQLAKAIGSSESSIKRWVDDGAITAGKTAGGHRRIALAEAVRFVRARGLEVVHPELFGVAQLAGGGGGALHGLGDSLNDALERGDAEAARDLVLSAVIQGADLAALFDGPMREAITRVGDLWNQREDGVMIEHRASLICGEILGRLELDFVPGVDDGPGAVGGAHELDASSLPTWMASLVLRGVGVRAVNLGARTPIDALLHAAERYDASLAWLSVNHAEEPERTRNDIIRFAHETHQRSIRCVLGGRALAGLDLDAVEHIEIVGSLEELQAIGKGMRA